MPKPVAPSACRIFRKTPKLGSTSAASITVWPIVPSLSSLEPVEDREEDLQQDTQTEDRDDGAQVEPSHGRQDAAKRSQDGLDGVVQKRPQRPHPARLWKLQPRRQDVQGDDERVDEPERVEELLQRRDVHPSSPALRIAAVTPSMMAPRTPRRSISARPAAAVPPGEVTLRRRSEQARFSAARSSAVPPTVDRIRRRALSCVRPETIPASSNASTIRPRNAGPEPESAVAASNSRSSSGTTSPRSEKHASTASSAAVSVNLPVEKASVPAPTRTPTFGMNRNTGASTSRIVSSVAVRTPAATDAIALLGVIRSLTSRSTRSTSIGLTHSTTTSACSTRSWLLATWRTPCRSASAAARPEPRSVTSSLPAIPSSARTQPCTIAPAMLPAPISPRMGSDSPMVRRSVPCPRPPRASGLVEEAALHQHRL